MGETVRTEQGKEEEEVERIKREPRKDEEREGIEEIKRRRIKMEKGEKVELIKRTKKERAMAIKTKIKVARKEVESPTMAYQKLRREPSSNFFPNLFTTSSGATNCPWRGPWRNALRQRFFHRH